MTITLPPRPEGLSPITIEDNKNIVIIGANGSGKTRIGSYIEENYTYDTHRISAQKSLTIPQNINITSTNKALIELLYGSYDIQDMNWLRVKGKFNHRWGNNLNTTLLNDYNQLLTYLLSEEAELAIQYKNNPNNNFTKPISRLDKIKAIWEEILQHRKLIIRAGKIEVHVITQAPTYNASEMSDGDRVMIYQLGEILSVNDNSIVIIDEPEMHIHKSILIPFWNKIENMRNDCQFVYLTHDIEFAASRINSVKIWVKS